VPTLLELSRQARDYSQFLQRASQPVGDVLYDYDEPVPEQGDVRGRDRTQRHVSIRWRDVRLCSRLLETVFENGRRTGQAPSIDEIRQRAANQIASLPEEFKRLRNPEIYRVILSDTIGQMKEELLSNREQV